MIRQGLTFTGKVAEALKKDSDNILTKFKEAKNIESLEMYISPYAVRLIVISDVPAELAEAHEAELIEEIKRLTTPKRKKKKKNEIE